MENQHTEFDKKAYVKINKARELWLNRCLDDLPVRNSLKAVLDLGCGAGYFSNMLSNFRAGIEAGIYCLKRACGLTRCTWKGLDHFKSFVWSSVVAHNLALLARLKPA